MTCIPVAARLHLDKDKLFARSGMDKRGGVMEKTARHEEGDETFCIPRANAQLFVSHHSRSPGRGVVYSLVWTGSAMERHVIAFPRSSLYEIMS